MDLPIAGSSSGTRRVVSKEEKTAAVDRLLAGQSIASVAADFQVAKSTVSRWMSNYRDEGISAILGLPKETKAPKEKKPPVPEADKKLFSVTRKNLHLSIKELVEMSGFPGSEALARKKIKEAKIKWIGPKETKRRAGRAKQLGILRMYYANDPEQLKSINKIKL